MADFSRFSELPQELRLQIWEAAIPRSPSVHFLSYPSEERHTKCKHDEWRSELVNANRNINVDRNPNTGEPSMRVRTWDRYSSYLASLALLHACQESRRVCLAHTASSNAHDSDAHGGDSSNIVSTDHYTLNLATDIICIQDPDPSFPWSRPRYLSLEPGLDPVRIALERRPYLDCGETEFRSNWIRELSGGSDGEFGCGTSLGNEYGDLSLKAIYLLDYDIKPNHAVVAKTTENNHDGNQPPKESGVDSDDCSAAKLPGHTSTHNGKFHGHGVTFYALSANIKETYAGWVIPQESRDFYSDVMAYVCHRYGFAVVDSLEEAKKQEFHICVEFLACVKA